MLTKQLNTLTHLFNTLTKPLNMSTQPLNTLTKQINDSFPFVQRSGHDFTPGCIQFAFVLPIK